MILASDISSVLISSCASSLKHMENLQEKDKVRKSLKDCVFYQGWALLTGTGLERNREAARGLLGLESEIKELEDQEIKNQSSFSCWAAVVLFHRALRG